MEILELYSKGASDEEVWVLIYTKRGTFSDDLWTRWLDEEPEFSGTIHTGRKFCKAWWVAKGRNVLHADKFQNQVYRLHMGNRFDWREKKDVENSGTPIVQVVNFADQKPQDVQNNLPATT